MDSNMSEPRILTAPEGMVYTNGEVYGTEVWLGVNDSPDNWTLVPDSEVPDVDGAAATEEDYLAALAKLGVK
jgi:hypothetical protein